VCVCVCAADLETENPFKLIVLTLERAGESKDPELSRYVKHETIVSTGCCSTLNYLFLTVLSLYSGSELPALGGNLPRWT